MNLRKMLKDAATQDEILSALGLERRSGAFARIAGSIGLLAAGVAVGAGVAMLFAPRPGAETREQIGRRLSETGSRVKEALREVRQGRGGSHFDIESSDVERAGPTRGM